MLERKYRYDGTVVDYECTLLEQTTEQAVLFYGIAKSFEVAYSPDQQALVLPAGSYTIAYYWTNRPYNVYLWRDAQGQFLGAYFNIARHTVFSETQVSFEDLIVDLLQLPDGRRYVLDEDELPLELEQFESGQAASALRLLNDSLDGILPQLLLDSESFLSHEAIRSFCEQAGGSS